MLVDVAHIPERLEGEPARAQPSASKTAAVLVRQLLTLCIALILAPVLWLLYPIPRLIYGKAPIVPSTRQLWRFLRRSWTEAAPPPGIPLSLRVRMTLEVLRIALMGPLVGLAWYLDELLYGKQLDAVQVVEPIIELSAARSGSTQMARYLEEDPRIVTSSLVESLFPFLWLWKIAPGTLGRVMTRERIEKANADFVGPLFLERHEASPLASETFDVVFFAHHLNGYGRLLGPRMLREDCSFADVYEADPELWDRDFVDLVDRLARKSLLRAGPAPDGGPRRYFIKGHFIVTAAALERRFPDAHFLVVLRSAVPRVLSVINFLAVAPEILGTGHAPWSWLVEGMLPSELRYNDLERAWITTSKASICVIRFEDYVRDLPGTMRRIYRSCLGREPPPEAPREHTKRKRTGYSIDRSFAQLGIDEAWLEAQVADYERWRATLTEEPIRPA